MLLMTDPQPFPKAGIQSICNYQSNHPLRAIKDKDSLDGILIQATNSQIYCGTRHFLRKKASDEPFYHGEVTNLLADYECHVQRSAVDGCIQRYRNMIEGLKNATGCMRIEQNYDFVVLENLRDMSCFFTKHLMGFVESVGLSRGLIMDSEYNIHRDKVKKLANRKLAAKILNVFNYYEKHMSPNFFVWQIGGVPLFYLDILIVPFHIWPGLTLSYIDIFERMISDVLLKKNQMGFVPTVNLEVIAVFERFLQYLFSGNAVKLGANSLLSQVLFENVEKRNFPYLSPNFYYYEKCWAILPEKYPMNKMFCFSTFLSCSQFRSCLLRLETCLFSEFSSFTESFIEALKRILQALYEKSLGRRNSSSLEGVFNEKSMKKLLSSMHAQGCDVSLSSWTSQLIKLFGADVDPSRIKPIPLRLLRNLVLHRFDSIDILSSSQLSSRISTFLNNSNIKWIPLITEKGIVKEDTEVPFVNTISQVSRLANGAMQEQVLDVTMPGLLGSSAWFVINEQQPQFESGILDWDALAKGEQLVGFIVGGISSSAPNIFWPNTGDQSTASASIIAVYIRK